ncbi:MAG TPA: hypothetical protein VGZ22_12660 [Isosphaeraceae bacterium]|jgi:hypothetical protein|nr:hypothetical protein [Isosphaeraceae bacterium]
MSLRMRTAQVVAAISIFAAISVAAALWPEGASLAQDRPHAASPREQKEERKVGAAPTVPLPADRPDALSLPPDPEPNPPVAGTVAPLPPDPQVQPQPPADREQAADEFLNHARDQANAAIKTLGEEAETLRARLQKVEAGLARWQAMLKALEQAQAANRPDLLPQGPKAPKEPAQLKSDAALPAPPAGGAQPRP